MSIVTLFRNWCKVKSFRAKVNLLDFLSRHDILYARYKNTQVKTYTIYPPRTYSYFEVYRARGYTSYKEDRVIKQSQDWFYPKWKSNDVRNATLVLCNEIIENRMIVMKAFLNEFRINPPGFQPPVWVNRGTNKFVSLPAGLNPNKVNPREKAKVETTCVDLDSHRPTVTQVVPIDVDLQEHNRILSSMYRKLTHAIEEKGSQIQFNISNTVDNNTQVTDTLHIDKDIICPICNGVVLHDLRTDEHYCINRCREGKKYHFQKIHRVMWYDALDHCRERLCNLVYTYGD